MDPLPLLWAFGAAAVVCALGWRPWSGPAPRTSADGAPRSGPWASALGPLLVWLATWWGLDGGFPDWPPRVATDHLVPALAAAGCVGVLGAGRGSVRRGLGALLLLGVVAAWCWTALEVYRERHWSDQQPLLRLTGVVLLLATLAQGFSSGVRRSRGTGLGLLLGVHAGSAVALGFSSLTSAWLVGGLAVFLGGLWVLSLWRPGWSVCASFGAPGGLALGGLLANGTLFGSLPAGSALALGAASLAALLIPGRGHGPLRGWRGSVLGLLLAALGIALALWWAWPEPDPYGGFYG